MVVFLVTVGCGKQRESLCVCVCLCVGGFVVLLVVVGGGYSACFEGARVRRT